MNGGKQHLDAKHIKVNQRMLTMKYIIQTCKVGPDGAQTPPAFLEPFIHRTLYEITPIQQAIEFLRTTPQAEGVWIRVDSRAYSIIVYQGERPEYDKFAFKLEESGDGEDAGRPVLG